MALRKRYDPGDHAPSEFGGVRGPVQPVPHEPTAAEKLFLMKSTGQDPDNISDQRALGDRAFSEGVEEA